MESKQYLHHSIANFAKAKSHTHKLTVEEIKSSETKVIPVIIEVPKLCPNKYEMEKETGLLALDRVLHSSVTYPGNYGYVPQTLCGDGDPIDAVVLSTEPLHPGCVVFCRIVGVMMMVDDKGEDAKLICVIHDDPTQIHVNDAVLDLSNHTRIVICHFFETYKDLENKWSRVEGIRGKDEGHAELIRAIEMYQELHTKVEIDIDLPNYDHVSIQPTSNVKDLDGVDRYSKQFPETVTAFIEIPQGSGIKYKLDRKTAMLEVDYVLRGSVFYPAEYGFVPQTLDHRNKSCTIVAIASYSLKPGILANVRILGIIDMETEKGEDHKLLGVIDNDPRYLEYEDLHNVTDYFRDELKFFFEQYKNTKSDKFARLTGFRPKQDAYNYLQEAHQRYLQSNPIGLRNVPRYDRLQLYLDQPASLNVFITNPQNSSNIYRFDRSSGLFRLNRRLHSSMYFPSNMGFLPQTLNQGGNNLGVIVVSMFPFETGALVPCRIVGMLEAESNLGPNAQVICIPLNEPRMRHINDINDIPEHLKNEMYNYYANYKALEDKDSWNIVKSWHCKEDAEIVVRRAYDTFFMMGVRMEELEKRLEAESKAKITLEERLNSIERRLEQLSGN